MPPPIAGPLSDVIAGFRFSVVFMIGGTVPNLIDMRFQRVSGLSAEIATTTLSSGGNNLYAYKLPDRVEYGNLVLERGRVLASPLDIDVMDALERFELRPANVMVILHDDFLIPLCAWQFFNAYPVSLSTSDLDASKSEVVIDTLELAYTRMQQLKI
jgi:phage tail-like protein